MNVSAFSIRTQEGGLSAGLLCPTLEMSTGGFTVHPGEMAEAILGVFSKYGLKLRQVFLTGEVLSQENADAGDFLAGLLAQGIIPVLECPGWGLPIWSAQCPIRIARITEESWLGFPAQELRYEMRKPVDPKVSLETHGASSFVLVPPKSMGAGDLLDFLRKSQWNWRLYSTPSTRLKVDLTPRLRELEK